MKLVIGFLLLFSLVSSVLAFSDTGLLGSGKTVGGFWLADTATSNLSSGLVFNEKLADGSSWAVTYTSYRSAYFLTRNVTQLIVMRKYPLLGLGPIGVAGLIGLGGYYSPAVGGGLTGNGGVEFAIKPMKELSFSLPLCFSFFSDGFWMSALPSINVLPPFIPGYELFVGGRLDGMMIGSMDSAASSGSGKMNLYLAIGGRTSL